MRSLLFVLVSLALLFPACNNSEEPQLVDDFNRQTTLTHWADQIILPGYIDLHAQLDALRQASEGFVTSPDSQALANLRQSWRDAYLTWQRVSMFEVGKAAEMNYRNQMNVYPCDVVALETAARSGAANLELPSNLDIQGFPALEFLLFGIRTDDVQLLDLYTNDPDAQYLRAFIQLLAERMGLLTDAVLADWQNGYREDFISRDGSSAEASVDQVANAFMFYYEKNLRAGKVGIPAGVFAVDPLPGHVETPYEGTLGKTLLLTALDACQSFFHGMSYQGNEKGPGFASYLDYLMTEKNGEPLSAVIDAQFNAAREAILPLSDNLADQITKDREAMLMAYDELQRNVVNLKVDMFQALSISVAYVDADGD